MKQQKALIKLLYGFISFAFFMVFLDILGLARPLPDILAAIALLVACYYVGKYGKLPKSK